MELENKIVSAELGKKWWQQFIHKIVLQNMKQTCHNLKPYHETPQQLFKIK